MKRIDVKCIVREYPDDDGEYHTLTVRNHWNRNDRVHLEIEGKDYIFIGRDLIVAIENAMRCE